MQLPRPQSVTPIADYQLEIGFNNGEFKRLDMTPYLAYPAFAALREVPGNTAASTCAALCDDTCVNAPKPHFSSDGTRFMLR